MFEKSKRSLVAATRGGTYRVCDSSLGPTISTARYGTVGKTSTQVPFLGTGGRAKTLAITVIFLDDSQHIFEVEKSAKGSVLLDKVFQHLELTERDYFGLQFDELLPPPEVAYPLSSPHLRWIESSKSLKKQIRFSKPAESTAARSSGRRKSAGGTNTNGDNFDNGSKDGGSSGIISGLNYHTKSTPCQQARPSAHVYFRVKFFVDDPAKLNEEYTRYHVFLQLKKDILEGRLNLTPSMSCLLASYAVQSELGDFNSDEQDEEGNYLKNIDTSLLLLRGDDVLRKIVQLHKMHKGQTPADAEFNFLMHAKRLEAYGINFHRVKDNLGKEIEIGVSSLGISVFHNGVKMNTFSWSKITKIAFKRKNFFIQLRRELSEEYDTLLMFDCWSYRSCKRLWKACVEHHAFFRLSAPPPPNRRPTLLLLALGSRFRYSGRTEYQTREENTSRSQSRDRSRERKTFFRSPSKKLLQLRQTLSGNKPSLEPMDVYDGSKYNSMPASPQWEDRKSGGPRPPSFVDNVQSERDARENKENMDVGSNNSNIHHIHQVVHLHGNGNVGIQSQNGVSSINILSSNGRRIENTSSSSACNNNFSTVTVTSPNISSLNRNALTRGSGPTLRAYDKVHQTLSEKEPRQAWAEDSNSDESGINLPQISSGLPPPPLTPGSNPVHISLLAKGIKFADDDENSISDDGSVSIRLEPDVQSKFGFNIKGGCDMGCPVLVSRVAPGTPADQGYPRLSEGDQLITINGKDTSVMMHRDIVNSIRHAATVKKELLLRVRPNVYSSDEYEEPPFQYVPDVPLFHGGSENDYGIQSELSSSMMLLAEAIESDSISSQFELIFRRKPGLSCEISKMPENLNKNRYRDISPYDSTRVILNSPPSGDYINASYVTMEIAASGIVNRYIATQGPLSSTCDDFWLMVWETQSPLIVMLTPICEHGRIKCHPYWPQGLNSPVVYHNLKVTTIVEKHLALWTHREFQIKDLETDEERVVVQLMYQSWPDHGVPDEPMSFIRFIEEVRRLRLGTVEPTVIHCSAGIGRTGVLILMETAECLIEANQPVYPVDIVTQMRLQRPLMIQTPSQYRFVCECVLRVFQKGMIRPLPEFCIPATSSPSQALVTTSNLGSRARAFCSSWFHSTAQQQQLHSGA